ncbi:MAG: radical SAM protein [Anaerolineales bacterium]|jgi:MoaA/NifB/PqqE/SkfB family radical SAM enzyme|nr:radical SAM protein [Anaerolineales bacterium]
MNYQRNLARLAFQQNLLEPLVAIYYVTTHCNLNCAYCEDFGARRNAQNQPAAPLEEAKRILRILRSAVDSLWLTGGEPLLAPHLFDLMEFAKRELRFRSLTVISNATLLPSQPEILPLLDRLVISLDTLDPQAWAALNMPKTYAESIPGIVRATAKQQKKHGFKLILNAVITPENLENSQQFEQLIGFCIQNKTWISFSPQSVNNWPRYELTISPVYQQFIKKLIALKKNGAPILGSFAYLKTLLRLEPYDCYPTLIPRILPGGELEYPCRPIAKAGGEQGGREINLLDYATWQEAVQAARQRYGEPPSACNSCFQQCYAEPSLMQSRPLEYWLEKADLATFAPG